MIQLEGPVTINSTDYSDYITSLVITRRRETTNKPATFGNSRSSQKAGSIVEEVTINFLNGIAASEVWAELWDAIDTDTAELTFSARLDDAVIGTDNPSFSGTMVVTGVSVGGDVGIQNQQRWTFPVTDAGITKATA